jgi:hypothetical protein
VLTAGAWDDNANFQLFLGYQQSIFELQLSGLLTLITIEQQQSAHDAIAYVPTPRDLLDVALVIDTTGSMADELGYLQAEFEAISSAIFAQHPNAQQRWSLVVYRDEGDQYVVRTFAFTTDIKAFQADLAQQSADGGGDYPEAPDQALAAMNTLAWRQSNSVARLAFWVADAPHHAQRADAMASSIQGAQAAGIHVYPVASSGVDDLTELTMRSAAQLTGGRYLFLTDDSGVGGSHKEPTIPCYFVTKLNAAVVRAVDMEMTGVYHLPDTSEIIRTVGDPVQGVCQLVSGSQAVAY